MDPDLGADPPNRLCCCCCWPPKRLVAGLEGACPNAEAPNGFLLAASVLGVEPRPLKNPPPELELAPPKIPPLELCVADPPKMEPLDAAGMLELKGDLKMVYYTLHYKRDHS